MGNDVRSTTIFSPIDSTSVPDKNTIKHNNIFGDECPSETDTNLAVAVNAAAGKGLPKEEVPKLRALLFEFRDLFWSRLGSDLPYKNDAYEDYAQEGCPTF